MNSKRNLNGAALASSVALLLLAGAGCGDSGGGDDTSGTQEPLRCLGGNDCKAMSECATPDGKSSCVGMNDCAGMGWIYTKSEKECSDKGGTVLTEDPHDAA